MLIQMQVRRGTTSEWEAANTVLAEGEPGYETNLKRLKIGDGVTAWQDLQYTVGGTGDGSVTIISTLPPSQPNEGDGWLNSDTGVLSIYNGVEWVATTGGSGAGGGSVTTVSATEPTNPADGDGWFSTVNQKLYIYNGVEWVVVSGSAGGGGANVTISETVPLAASQGDLWFDSSTGKMYVYYDFFWVEPVHTATTGATGKSAYQSAVDFGFVGTESEWLLSLKGEDGIPGPASTVAGPPGQDGIDGRGIVTGEGEPNGTVGEDGDLYIDTANARMYGPKVLGTWPLNYVSLIGSAGKDGVSFVYNGAWQSAAAYLYGDWVKYAGALWVCNGNIVSPTTPPPYDAGWDLAVDPSNHGYNPDALYFPQGATGTVTAASIGTGYSRLCPIYLPVGYTLDKLFIELTATDASGTALLGIYSDNGNSYPYQLLASGSISTSGTAGMRSVSIAASNIKSSGLMWVALKVESSTATFRAISSGAIPLVRVPASTVTAGLSLANGYATDGTRNGTGTLAATFPTWNNVAGFAVATSIPRVGVSLV